MPKEKITTSTILEEVNKTLLMIGLESTVRALRYARENPSGEHIIKFTILTVCRVLEIEIHQLSERTETIRYAKGFIVFYLRNEFEIEWKEIKQALNHRDQSWLWDLLKTIEEMKPNLPVNKKWMEAKQKIDQQIKEFKIQKK